MARIRRKQIEIGWTMVKFLEAQKEEFLKEQLRLELGMNTNTLNDWFELYKAFNAGPEIRSIKVNSKTIYEVVRKPWHTPLEIEEGELGQKAGGQRKTKLQVGMDFLKFIHQVERAFFRSTLEQVLGMALPHSLEWIQLYQLFNQGLQLIERKQGRRIYFQTKHSKLRKGIEIHAK